MLILFIFAGDCSEGQNESRRGRRGGRVAQVTGGNGAVVYSSSPLASDTLLPFTSFSMHHYIYTG